MLPDEDKESHQSQSANHMAATKAKFVLFEVSASKSSLIGCSKHAFEGHLES